VAVVTLMFSDELDIGHSDALLPVKAKEGLGVLKKFCFISNYFPKVSC
jgi:hypothetical protein